MDTQKTHPQLFSCEFFPPNSEAAAEKLSLVQQQLSEVLKPAFFSVTYGAGGTTQERTFAAVIDIQRNSGVAAAPHLTCVSSTRPRLREILNTYQQHGINRVVALRGDRPSGAGLTAPGELRYANELVEFIRAETGNAFTIEVAAYPEVHPQAQSAQSDLDHFQRKVAAGADSAITQYFYNADAYFRFIDCCERRGIDLPIVPGIMPITNYKQLARFSDLCGAEIPRWIRKSLEDYGDDLDSIRAFGIDMVSDLCQRLLQQGAPGLHFYTMNRADTTLAIYNQLTLPEVC